MKDKTSIIITGMILIAIIELLALLLGYNGMMLATVVGIIAGLAGWTQKTPKILNTDK